MNRCFVFLLLFTLITVQISYADDTTISQGSPIINEDEIQEIPPPHAPSSQNATEEETDSENDTQSPNEADSVVPIESPASLESLDSGEEMDAVTSENESDQKTTPENGQVSEKEQVCSDDADDPVKQLRINEILANPDGTDAGNEFIELYNDGDTSLNISEWHICDLSTYDQDTKNCDLTKSGTYTFPAETIIDAKTHHAIFNKQDFSFAINNTNETIYVTNIDNALVLQFHFSTSSSGLSWNYGTDHWYEEVPTPRTQNIEDPLTKEYPPILINEIFPFPSDNETHEEFIELYNPHDHDMSLKNWKLRDGSASGEYIFSDITISSQSFLIIYRDVFSFALNNYGDESVSLIAPNSKTSSSISYTGAQKNMSLNTGSPWYWADATPGAINAENPLTKEYLPLYLSEILPNPIGDENTDEYIEIYNPNSKNVDLGGWMIADSSTSGRYIFPKHMNILPYSYLTIYRSNFQFALNNTKESVYLIAPNTKTISEISYDSSREAISLNYDNHTNSWRWSKHLTPEKENVFNNLPIITHYDVDNSTHKNVYAAFSIDARDVDNETLKVRWDFGDGRRSYLWDTRHKYTENGVYHGSVRIQDDSEEVVNHFTVSVTDYPKHKIVITRIMPNPAGKDTGNEYLMIQNKSNKRINLKNWSVATGSSKKTLVNHPIYDDLFIKPGKEKMITRKISAISLPNKTGVIEIRRPNGTVSDDRSYGYEGKNIPDNAIYEEIDDQWQWLIYIDPETQKKIDALIAQALFNEKSIARQLLEREIAFQAIHAPINNDPTQIVLRSHNTLDRVITHKINALINRVLLHVKERYAKRSINSKISGEPYAIPNNDIPCDTSYINIDHALSLCK